MLNSTATVMSEAMVAAAVRDGADKRVGNGESSIAPRAGAVATGAAGSLSIGNTGGRSAAAGVQTTPSVNGAVEMNEMKTELAKKNQQLQQLNTKLEEYKDNMLKVRGLRSTLPSSQRKGMYRLRWHDEGWESGDGRQPYDTVRFFVCYGTVYVRVDVYHQVLRNMLEMCWNNIFMVLISSLCVTYYSTVLCKSFVQL